MRASRAAFLVVATVLAGGLTYLLLTSGTEVVYVANRDLPAYHQITQEDVRQFPMNRGQIPDDAVRDRDVLLNRYTLVAILQDHSFQKGQLGPKLPPNSLATPIFALAANGQTTIAGRLARGDRVDVIVSSSSRPNLRLTQVLVVDVVDGPNAAVVLGVTETQSTELTAATGATTVGIIRVQPYVGS